MLYNSQVALTSRGVVVSLEIANSWGSVLLSGNWKTNLISCDDFLQGVFDEKARVHHCPWCLPNSNIHQTYSLAKYGPDYKLRCLPWYVF